MIHELERDVIVQRIMKVFALLWLGGALLGWGPKDGPEKSGASLILSDPEVRILDREGGGKLLQVERWLVCVMEGAPAEMGFQHGRLLAGRIRGMVKERYMAQTLYGRGYTPGYVDEQAARMEKHFPPEYVDEIKGIVKGLRAAGVEDVTYEHLRAGVCIAELQHHAPGAPPGCTNFAVFGKWTRDGGLLHGRNLDWSINGRAQDDAVILIWRPRGGAPFMMVGWAGCIGSVSGMNAAGITIGEMTCSSPDETFDGLPLFLIMRRVLEKTASLDEAVRLIQEGPRTLGWNFVIGDGKIPDARALEVDAKTCEVYAPLDPKEEAETGHSPLADAIRRTNHPCGGEPLKKVAGIYARKLGLKMPEWEAARPLVKAYLSQGNSWRRYHWLGERIRSMPGGIGVEEAVELLGSGPVKCGATLHSCVFDPVGRTAYVSNAGVDPKKTASEMPYIRIDLKKWFEKPSKE